MKCFIFFYNSSPIYNMVVTRNIKLLKFPLFLEVGSLYTRGLCDFGPGWSLVVQWRVHVWRNYNEKNCFSRPTFRRSYSDTQGVAKPPSPLPAGVGGPWNPKSLNPPTLHCGVNSNLSSRRLLICLIFKK